MREEHRLHVGFGLRTLAATRGFDLGGDAMNDQAVGLLRLGRYSLVAVGLSLVVGYGADVLTAAGMPLDLHEGVRVTGVVAFAWLAVLAMGINIPRHQSFAPFILGDIGALLVSWVMLVSASRGLEVLGFAMLVVAAVRDRHLRLRVPASRREPESRH